MMAEAAGAERAAGSVHADSVGQSGGQFGDSSPGFPFLINGLRKVSESVRHDREIEKTEKRKFPVRDSLACGEPGNGVMQRGIGP